MVSNEFLDAIGVAWSGLVLMSMAVIILLYDFYLSCTLFLGSRWASIQMAGNLVILIATCCILITVNVLTIQQVSISINVFRAVWIGFLTFETTFLILRLYLLRSMAHLDRLVLQFIVTTSVIAYIAAMSAMLIELFALYPIPGTNTSPYLYASRIMEFVAITLTIIVAILNNLTFRGVFTYEKGIFTFTRSKLGVLDGIAWIFGLASSIHLAMYIIPISPNFTFVYGLSCFSVFSSILLYLMIKGVHFGATLKRVHAEEIKNDRNSAAQVYADFLRDQVMDHSPLKKFILIPDNVTVLNAIHEAILKKRSMKDLSYHDHVYFEWKMHSLNRGESMDYWNTDPMTMDNIIWYPPRLLFKDSLSDSSSSDCDSLSDSSSDSSNDMDWIENRFYHLLKNMSLHYSCIGKVMVFCIDHSNAHPFIIDMIISSITSPGILLQDKLPRFYLIHDILYNCSVSNAWKYRNELEKLLPFVFQHFGIVYRRIESRLRAESVKKIVMQVIDLWEQDHVYSSETCEGYRQLFLLEKPEEKDHDLDGVPLDNDLDGVPLDNDLDGEPLDNDLDGVPLEIIPDPDLDGEPLDMSLFQ